MTMKYPTGARIKTNTVPKINPKLRLVAIGINTCTWREVSSKIGVMPPIVVSDVNITGRQRRRPASMMASLSVNPSLTRRLMKSIKSKRSIFPC